MRLILSVLGMSIVMIAIFLAQSGQLSSLKALPEVSKILGETGSRDSDFSLAAASPQRILESFKKTMTSLRQRDQFLLEDEGGIQGANHLVVESSKNSDPIPENLQEQKPVMPASMNARTDSATENIVSKYGMSLIKITDEEAQPYLGQWMSKTQGVTIKMHLQRDHGISSLRLRADPDTHISFGHNQFPLWKNTKTGAIVFALSEDDYLQLSPTESGLRGALYQRTQRGKRSRTPEAAAFRSTLTFQLRASSSVR